MISRRDFLKTSSAALAYVGTAGVGVGSFPADVQAKVRDAGLGKKNIIGYCWPWTARPGEKIDFKVSALDPGEYRADMVRLICADAITDGGKHYKEEAVTAPLNRSYPGRRQPVYKGSYVHIEDTEKLDRAMTRDGSFTLVASVLPTLVSRGSELQSGGFTPGMLGGDSKKQQHIISRWNDVTKSGWALAIDEDEKLAFYAGDGSGQVQKVSLRRRMALRRWAQVGVTYDAESQQLTLFHIPVTRSPGERVTRKTHRASGTINGLTHNGPLRFAASVGGEGNGPMPQAAYAYNGKLDTVRMVRGVVSEQEDFDALFDVEQPRKWRRATLGWWDFAKGTGTTKVDDLSRNGLNGVTVNLPERAVMGVHWDGTQFNWQNAPAHYSAMSFHDDDLIDCEWQTDFDYVVPDGLRSGMYAVRLRHGDGEDYVPFFVAPAKNAPKAKLAFIVPTINYLAYTNTIGSSYWMRKVLLTDEDGGTRIGEEEWMPMPEEEQSHLDFMYEHYQDMGKALYSFHTDGGLVRHASMRMPNLASKPKSMAKNITADTDIIEWLEHEGIDYDVITEELIHAEGIELLSGYQALMTGSHAEYHSWDMINAFQQYLDQGGRLMSIGGNGFHIVVHFHSEIPGVVECRKRQGGSKQGHDVIFESFSEFDGRRTGRFREIGHPANMLHGVGTNYPHPATASTYYRRLPEADNPRARFIFDGVNDEILGNFGKAGGGAVGEECDSVNYTDGTPEHALVVARSENMVYPMVGDNGLTDPKYQLNFDPKAEIVFFETPNGGAVFSVGSMAYRGSLSHNQFDNNIAKITKNVLDRFIDPEPFEYPLS